MRSKILFLILPIVAAFVLAACGGAPASGAGNATPIPPTSDAPNSAPTQPVPDTNADAAASPLPASPQAQQVSASSDGLAARVNSTDITLDDLNRAVARFQQQQAAADPAALQATVLDTLIEQALIEQAAAAQNVQVTDAEVQAELDAIIQQAGDANAWNQWLTDNLYTAEEFRETMRDTLLTARMRDLVTQDVNANIMQVHARHILVATENEANSILAQLNSGGDFVALAAQHSRDVTTKDQGGDLGWFAQDELLEPYLAQVAFSLEPGAIAGPVPTALGFHIVQVIEKGERPIPEDKRPIVAQNQFENWLTELRGTATIERFI